MPNTRPGSNTHIRVACYHEAGHAVAAVYENRHVSRVTVDYARPGNGRMWYSRGRLGSAYDPSRSEGAARAAWMATQTRLLADIRIKLAGPLAEAKALGQPLRALGAYSDLEGARATAERLEQHREHLAQFVALPRLKPARVLDVQRRYVRRWVGRPRIWYLISRVAERLNRYPEVSATTIARELHMMAAPTGQHLLRLGAPVGRSGNRRSGRLVILGPA